MVRAHVSYDPFVQSCVPEAPKAGEGVVVVDAVLHVLAWALGLVTLSSPFLNTKDLFQAGK
jgi:hypothetical protein